MTTIYRYHRWIEQGSTSETVLGRFGIWWDADAGGGGGFQAAWARNCNTVLGACAV